MVQIYRSRWTPGLGPGDGEKVGFTVGETVDVIVGIDKGREFVVDSDRMRHADAGTDYVREGWFVDDPTKTRYAKSEKHLWFKPDWFDHNR